MLKSLILTILFLFSFIVLAKNKMTNKINSKMMKEINKASHTERDGYEVKSGSKRTPASTSKQIPNSIYNSKKNTEIIKLDQDTYLNNRPRLTNDFNNLIDHNHPSGRIPW